MVLCFKKPLSVVGLGPLLPSAFSVLKIKMGQKKWRVSRLIIKSEDLISFKSILWETATHQCQLCLLLESIIFLKSYLILWKCNLYNIKCKQTLAMLVQLQPHSSICLYFEVMINFLLRACRISKTMILKMHIHIWWMCKNNFFSHN